MTILAVSMFPQVAVLSGMFELIRALGLYNTLPGLILANLMLTLPFTVWVLTTFMRELPRELEEAALVDGATPLDHGPARVPAADGAGAVTTGLLAFIVAWNEFLFALTFTLTNEQRTVPVAIALMSGATAYELPWGSIMAASVIVTCRSSPWCSYSSADRGGPDRRRGQGVRTARADAPLDPNALCSVSRSQRDRAPLLDPIRQPPPPLDVPPGLAWMGPLLRRARNRPRSPCRAIPSMCSRRGADRPRSCRRSRAACAS